MEFVYQPNPSPLESDPPLPSYPVQLLLDDDTAEGDFGVSISGRAQQFLWFNRFTLPTLPIVLEEVWVLFSPGDNMAVGDPIELVVNHFSLMYLHHSLPSPK